MKKKINKWPVTLPISIGLTALIILIGGFGTWSMKTKISGAVIAQGKIKVEDQAVLQHLYGGIIKEINVRDGAKIKKDQILIVLDGIQTKSELAIVELQLYELIARRNRLESERDDLKSVSFNSNLLKKSLEVDEVRDIINGQKRLFGARLQSFEKEIAKIKERIIQIEYQISGKETESKAYDRQLELLSQDLKKSKTLFEKGLTLSEKILDKELEEAKIIGTISGLKANISELKGKITEFQIELVRQNSKRREQAIERLRDIKTRENELNEKRYSLSEQIKRLVIKAPTDGIVHNMKLLSEKNIIQAGEPILYIVPLNKALIVTSKIDTIDIDQLFIGQNVTIRFSAFDQRTTPEVQGFISKISPDALEDKNTGLFYYKTDIEISIEEIKKLNELMILPGMPAEIFIKTNERTPLSFLIKPLAEYFYKSFRSS